MPRRRTSGEEHQVRLPGNLAEQLATELQSNREAGQPMIYEKEFSNGKIRVNVIWDAWDRLPP